MNWAEYLQESKRTCSHEFHIEVANPTEALIQLGAFEKLSQVLDNLKKGLIYGRQPKPLTPVVETYNTANHADMHAILGIVTEAAELSTALRLSWDNPQEKDRLKIIDEAGDLMWYFAILCREYNIDLGEVLDANIAKLRARFPDKFSSDRAVNRNTDQEDSALAKAVG